MIRQRVFILIVLVGVVMVDHVGKYKNRMQAARDDDNVFGSEAQQLIKNLTDAVKRVKYEELLAADKQAKLASLAEYEEDKNKKTQESDQLWRELEQKNRDSFLTGHAYEANLLAAVIGVYNQALMMAKALDATPGLRGYIGRKVVEVVEAAFSNPEKAIEKMEQEGMFQTPSTIRYIAQMTPDGNEVDFKTFYDTLETEKGEPLTEENKAIMRTLFSGWLERSGYSDISQPELTRLDENRVYFTENDPTIRLDSNALNERLNDKERGFDAFCRFFRVPVSRMDLSPEPTPAPRR